MDTGLKQRLIGAAVLVALAVIFLPMLVKGPAPDSGVSNVPLTMPDAPDGKMETHDLPLVGPGAVPKGGAVGMETAPVDRPATAVANGAPAAAANPLQNGSSDNATPSAVPAATAGGDYAVHFGAYASAKAADTVATLAKAAQLPAYSETTTVNGKPAWRVRIGPFATRAEAESARLKAIEVRSDVPVHVVVLNAETAATSGASAVPAPTSADSGKPATAAVESKPEPKPPAAKPPAVKPIESKPVESKPVESKPTAIKPATDAKPTTAASKPNAATAPAKPAPNLPAPNTATNAAAPIKPVAAAPAAAKVGFAVQLGAFGDAAEATALRDRLRAAGFSAFTEMVNTDKGKLTRVRVGPVVDRAAADQLKAQVQAKTGVSGIVRPHP